MQLKKRKDQSTRLYTSIRQLNTYLYPIIDKLQKDIKITYGHELIKDTIILLKLYKKSYKEENLKTKIKLINNTINIIENIDLITRMLHELKHISTKQLSNIIIYVAEILVQLESWRNSTISKVDGE